jgi:signal transduction histidine kinase
MKPSPSDNEISKLAGDHKVLKITAPFITKLLLILCLALTMACFGVIALQYQTRKSLHEGFSQNYARFLSEKISQILGRYPDVATWEKDGNELSLQLRKLAPISGLSGIVITNTQSKVIGTIPAETTCRPETGQGSASIIVNNELLGYINVCLEDANGPSTWEAIDLLAVGALTSRVGTDYSLMVASLLTDMISQLDEPDFWDLSPDAISYAVSDLAALKGIASVSVFNRHGDFVVQKFLNESGLKPVITTQANISFRGQIVGQVSVDIDFPEIRGVERIFRLYLAFGTGIAMLLLFAFPVAVVRRLEKAARASYRALHDSHVRLQETQAQLVSSAKMAALGTMASGIAHEINNPLTIIVGNTDALAMDAKHGRLTPESTAERARKISQTAFRIAKIVKSLRALAREGKQDPFSETAVQSVVSETLEICSERAKFLGVTLKVPEISESIMIECQSVQISQVILNLINNACDAVETLSDKWVEVGFKDGEAEIEITVTDSGPGIPDTVQATLFQPFFTTKPPGKGTGLGLSLSRQIIDSHGGTLGIDAKCENTRFVIKLPKKQIIPADHVSTSAA